MSRIGRLLTSLNPNDAKTTAAMSRRRRAAQPWAMAGWMFTFLTGLLGFFIHSETGRVSELREQGLAVRTTVSEKHVLEPDPGSGGSTWYRLFARKPAGLDADTAELWDRTAAAAKYPNSVTLFDAWEDRVWIDVPRQRFEATSIGDPLELRITGESFGAADAMPPGLLAWTLFAAAACAAGWAWRRGYRLAHSDLDLFR
jgi:hypothetical protein